MSILTATANVFRPSRLTGPIFTKELRVSSRRRRNYVLRFIYLALLTLFVSLVWVETMSSSYYYGYHGVSGAAQMTARMSAVGQAVVLTVAWFQYIMIILVSVVICSTAISEEVYRRTLATMLSTPITARQVVIGKMLSKLWQVLLLVAMSLPVLALVRLLGGVEWKFVAATVSVTLGSAIVCAAITMFYSVLVRQAWAAILLSLGTLGLLYIFLPMLAAYVVIELWSGSYHYGPPEYLMEVAAWLHPPMTMAMLSEEMTSPGGVGLTSPYWQVCSALCVAFGGLLLVPVAAMVRRRALRMALGATPKASARAAMPAPAASAATAAVPRAVPVGASAIGEAHAGGNGDSSSTAPTAVATAVAEGPSGPAQQPDVPIARTPAAERSLRHIRGCPVLWRELRAGLIQGPVGKILAVVLTVLILSIVYGICADANGFDDEETHAAFAIIYLFIGMLVTAVLASTTITTERESGSLHVLLTTPLSPLRIVLAKACGVWRRCCGPWALLFAHLLLFTASEFLYPVVILHMLLVVAYLNIFLVGAGVLASTLTRRTTTAVVMTLGLMLAIWLLLPMVLGIGVDDDLAEATLLANPMVHTGVSAGGGTANSWRWRYGPASAVPHASPLAIRYDWPDPMDSANARETTGLLWGNACFYGIAGVLMLLAAAGRLRRSAQA
jgi:ABC-type transport system involved in multi-copper enzyme maturation permease subunit